MRKNWKPAAAGLALALLLSIACGAASAETEAGTVKQFAKQGRVGAVIAFHEADFTDNQLGGGTLTGILVTAVSAPEGGSFQLDGGEICDGQVIPLGDADKLTFVPGEEPTDAVMWFLPLYADGGSEVSGRASSVTVHSGKGYNYAPSAPDLTTSTYEGMPIEVGLTAYDHEGDALTYTVVTAPASGTLSVENGHLVYTPDEDGAAKAVFTYYAADSAGNTSEPATVTIKVAEQTSGIRYADLTGTTLEYPAVRLAEENICTGRTIGTQRIFEADETLTRGEFVAMMAAAMGLEQNTPVGVVLSETCGWQGGYLAAAMEARLVDSARFGDAITPKEAAVIVARALDVTAEGSTAAAAVDGAPDRASAQLTSLRALGVWNGAIHTSGKLTRGDAARLIANACAVRSGERLGWMEME